MPHLNPTRPTYYYVMIFFLFVSLEWLMIDGVRKLVLVVKGVESKETLERWVFNCENTSKENSDPRFLNYITSILLFVYLLIFYCSSKSKYFNI